VKIWLAIVTGSALSIAALWCTSIPLGIPDEWTWDRMPVEPDFLWNLAGAAVAAGIFAWFALHGYRRLDGARISRWRDIETFAWLSGLTVLSFAWLWVVQEAAPVKNRFGKAAFVLYYTSSSGYYARARYEQPDPRDLLAGYEDLMRQGDVLHTGTHPPGLFVIFHGLISACKSSPALSAFLEATEPSSFREACDVIAANNMRRPVPRPFLPDDRRVLWLATLLVMCAASCVVFPLYGLLCRHVTRSTAWAGTVLWPALPAVIIFIPKSDVVFPLIGLSVLWFWLTAWDRRSFVLGLCAGLISWCGMFCSLAFLPVFLAAGLMTIGSIVNDVLANRIADGSNDGLSSNGPLIGWRRLLLTAAACVGFGVPTYLLWRSAQVNLLNVWWLNYQNHAGFYREYPRTWWKWLLANPMEVSFAAGWPIAVLTVVGCWTVLRGARDAADPTARARFLKMVGPLMFVWGLLWVTGKNSGEAARIWILLFPWLILLGSLRVESMLSPSLNYRIRERSAVALWLLQFAVCMLTVAQVRGFHPESG
jgi:hypothetical protein